MTEKEVMNLTQVDIKEAARQLAASPDLYRKFVAKANRRIKRLRADKYTKYSNAYQNAMIHLKKQGRKQFSVNPLAGKKNAYNGEHKDTYLGNAMELLQFVTAASSTKTGIKKIYANRKQNLITQIETYSDLSPDEMTDVEEMINNSSMRQIQEIFADYEAILNASFIAGSYDKFNLIGNDLASKISKYKDENKKKATYTAIRSVVQQGLKDFDKKVKKNTNNDEVNKKALSIQELGKLVGIDKPLKGSLKNKAKWDKLKER